MVTTVVFGVAILYLFFRVFSNKRPRKIQDSKVENIAPPPKEISDNPSDIARGIAVYLSKNEPNIKDLEQIEAILLDNKRREESGATIISIDVMFTLAVINKIKQGDISHRDFAYLLTELSQRDLSSPTKKNIINKEDAYKQSDNLDILALKETIAGLGHPDYPLLRKEYAVSSRIPCIDFSPWIVNWINIGNSKTILAFVQDLNMSSDSQLSRKTNAILGMPIEKYLNIEKRAIQEIKCLFIIEYESYSNLRYYAISQDNDMILSRILCVYPFYINTDMVNKLTQSIKRHLSELGRGREAYVPDATSDYYNPLINMRTDIIQRLSVLTIGERLHFFDAITIYSNRRYWTGSSTYRTRKFGIEENSSFDAIISTGIFSIATDISIIPNVAKKGTLAQLAIDNGFEIKKSWTLLKIYEELAKTEEGRVILASFLAEQKIAEIQEDFIDDIKRLLDYCEKIKGVVNLLTAL